MHDRLTRGDIEKMEAEIRERKLVKRPELIRAVQEAREQGDLSENFEYYAAKREKNINESRIRYLEQMIRTAVIVDDIVKDDREDVVALNKTVEIFFPDEGETEKVTIVTTIRGNSLSGRISIDSPLGRALMHKKRGDTVHVSLPEGGYDVVIRSVSAASDESGDAIRGF